MKIISNYHFRNNIISSEYDRNVAVIKDYGVKKKLCLHKCLRVSGFEVSDKKKRCTANSSKLSNNIARAKAKIFEYAYCNPWDWFVTLTIDKNKYERDNLKGFYKSFSQWLRDYQKKHNISIKYLLIPELHKDGESWHFHGFIYGLPIEYLSINSNGYYDWLAYRDKFGFISLGKIISKEKVSSYITKYISKDLSNSVKELNAKLYYCSRGLNVATELYRGHIYGDFVPDFENDYVSVKWYDKNISVDDLKQSNIIE